MRKCPREKGAIAIQFVRDDTGAAIPGVTVDLKGPTPGSHTSNKAGWTVFNDRQFGGYSYTLRMPQPHYAVLPHTSSLGVASSLAPETLTVLAYPTGTLNVKVIRDDTNAVIKEACTLFTVSGPESLSWDKGASYGFQKVRCGAYKVSARVTADMYDPLDPAAEPTVQVPEGGAAEARIVLTPRVWIGIRVHDEDAKKDLTKVRVVLRPTGGGDLSGVTDASGQHRFTLSKKHGTCEVQALEVDDDAIYEVVKVESK